MFRRTKSEPETPSTTDKVGGKGRPTPTRKEAEAYLTYLWSDEGQRIAANNYLRPRNPAILAEFADRFPKATFLNVVKTFGEWPVIQRTHFKEGGVFDQIYAVQ